ncbi:MAG: hypothetical protein AAGA54_24620 [Myxococcota bacterium]
MSERSSTGYEVGLLWLVLVVGMVLHFNYGVSGLRYGVSMEIDGADGTVPWSNFGIKTVFYVVPLLLAVGSTGGPGRGYRLANFGLTLLFALANVMHLVTTAVTATDVLGYAQTVLLTGVLLANVQLIRLSHRWRTS